MNTCDGGHDTNSEIKRLPLSKEQGSAILVCHKCYIKEMRFREERNWELTDGSKFDIPSWKSLEIYNQGE